MYVFCEIFNSVHRKYIIRIANAIIMFTTVNTILNLTLCSEKWVIFLAKIATVGTKITISRIKNSTPEKILLSPVRDSEARYKIISVTAR